MSQLLQPESPPLVQEDDGTLRVGHTRVLFDLVVRAFQDGATPETIAQRYPSLSLTDTYAAIAYYLRHRDAMDAYLATREAAAMELRSAIESSQSDLPDLRTRIASRRMS